MKVVRLWFDDGRLFIETGEKEVLSQPLRFYPRLAAATDRQRAAWKQSYDGLHWAAIDEDISFESFRWGDDDPARLWHRPAARATC